MLGKAEHLHPLFESRHAVRDRTTPCKDAKLLLELQVLLILHMQVRSDAWFLGNQCSNFPLRFGVWHDACKHLLATTADHGRAGVTATSICLHANTVAIMCGHGKAYTRKVGVSTSGLQHGKLSVDSHVFQAGFRHTKKSDRQHELMNSHVLQHPCAISLEAEVELFSLPGVVVLKKDVTTWTLFLRLPSPFHKPCNVLVITHEDLSSFCISILRQPFKL
mmetsp:Transcript_96520/g.191278  ORF Transcript_96520/g.191278 Transcript_96520/m.191278 type:complete len:220 (-) Transcript_96520:453-1112(-)